MATMIEKKAESIRKEIAKLEERLARYEAKYEKAYNKAAKMDALERKEIWDEINPENPAFRKPEHIPYFSAYFDYYGAKRDVEETKEAIKRANERLEKVLPQIEKSEKENKEADRIEAIGRRVARVPQMTKEEYEAWLAEFKAECLKDGVVIDEYLGAYIWGTAKDGRKFALQINSGYTVRSLYCFTLYMDGETIFTSGTFERAYKILKR